jgi:phosphatidylethanolamine-binding protein (PEBP) family uncharacterized protein
MQLGSSDLSQCSGILGRLTCGGEDLSPRMHSSDARNLVLLCNDPDPPAGKGPHWAAYEFPCARVSLAKGSAWEAEKQGIKRPINGFRLAGCGGFCPLHHHGTYPYQCRPLAWSIDHLSMHQFPTCKDVEREARKHTLPETVVLGVYER